MPALHGTRLLLEDLQQLKDAPKTDKCLVEDKGLCRYSTQIASECGRRECDLLGAGIAKQLETMISSSIKACERFRADLQR